jgi:CBS-domain-containing membrane protein
MTRPVRSVRTDATVLEAVKTLLGKHFRAMPVVDVSWHLVGVASNSDLVARGGLGARSNS